MTIDVPVMIGAVLIGFVVGGLTGLFGVGGGFLMTPALMIFLNIPGDMAVGTDLAVIFANSTMAIVRRIGSHTLDFKLGLVITSGSMIGVALGSAGLERLGAMGELVIFGKNQDPVQFVLLFLFLGVLAFIAMILYIDYKNNQGQAPAKRIGLFSKFNMHPMLKFSSLEISQLSIVPLVLLGVFMGFLTGLMGIGGGVVLLPSLVYLVGQRTQKAIGTSLMLVWFASLFGAIRRHVTNDINPELLGALLAGGLTGSVIGTKFGLKIAGPKLRFYFMFIIITAVVLIGIKCYTLVV